jgi:hypothetical protein
MPKKNVGEQLTKYAERPEAPRSLQPSNPERET